MNWEDLATRREEIGAAAISIAGREKAGDEEHGWTRSSKTTQMVFHRHYAPATPGPQLDVIGVTPAGFVGKLDLSRIAGLAGAGGITNRPVYIYAETVFRRPAYPMEPKFAIPWAVLRTPYQVAQYMRHRASELQARVHEPVRALMEGVRNGSALVDDLWASGPAPANVKLQLMVERHIRQRAAAAGRWLAVQLDNWVIDAADRRMSAAGAEIPPRFDMPGCVRTMFGAVPARPIDCDPVNGADRASVLGVVDRQVERGRGMYGVSLTKTLAERNDSSPMSKEWLYAWTPNPWHAIDMYVDSAVRIAWQECKALLDLARITVAVANEDKPVTRARSPLKLLVIQLDRVIRGMGADGVSSGADDAVFRACHGLCEEGIRQEHAPHVSQGPIAGSQP